MYTAELAPPAVRGFMVGLCGVMVGVGYMLANFMGLAFFYSTDPVLQWRAPLGISLVFPVVLLCSMPFLPESPRYLLMSNQPEKAWNIISKLHAVKSDPDQEFARGEFYQMKKQIELERTLPSSWLQMFKRKSYRKRSFLAMAFSFIGQSTAVLIINNFVCFGPLQASPLFCCS